MASKPVSASKPAWVVLACAGALGLSGCADAGRYWQQLQKEVDALLIVLKGGQSPLAKGSPAPTGAASPVVTAAAGLDASAQSKINAELLQEMYRIVLIREPKDRSEFGSLVDTLNQGASFEGLYNGFTHSADYRQMEHANPGASPDALKVFASELAELEAELPEPTEFTEKSALPLAAAVQPGMEGGGGGQPAAAQGPEGVSTLEFGKKEEAPPAPVAAAPPAADAMTPASPKPFDKAAAEQRYLQIFIGASIYTMKRVLGDSALRVMEVKREYTEKFALWYGKWVLRICGRNVDFGLGLRNKADEQFHYKWALAAAPDRLQWEVLNRLHRVLNDANRQKQ